MNPANPRNLVAAWKQDIDSPDSTADGVAVSLNGGRSWRRGTLPRGGACDGGEAQFTYVADPWLAFGPREVVWVATLPYTQGNPGAVAVHRSTDGGRTFGGPRYVDRDQTQMDFDDKETMAADPRDARRAYVTWVKQQRTLPPLAVPLSSTIYVSRTLDRGRTWSAPRALATTGSGTALAGGVVAVRPNRDVLLAYPRIVPDNPGDCVSDEECAGVVTVFAVRSRDGGSTWSAPVVAARYRRGPVRDPEGEEFKASADNFSLTVDPRGVAYLAAHDERDSPNSHIVVRRSRDGGASWRSLTEADSASRARGFKGQPIIAAGRRALGILYYDFRDDVRRGDGKAEFSWWFVHSDNRGRNWHEQRLTGPSDLHSAPATAVGHFIGDYFGLQPVGRDFVAAVTLARPRARRGPTDIFFTRVASRCLASRSPVGARKIGRIRLGYSRRRLLRLPLKPARRTGRSYRYCVKRSRGGVSAAFSGRGRVVLVATTARGHGNRNVRPGRRARSLRAYRSRLKVGPGLFRASPRSSLLIGVRRGRVRFVAVVDRRVLRSLRSVRRYLRVAGL